MDVMGLESDVQGTFLLWLSYAHLPTLTIFTLTSVSFIASCAFSVFGPVKYGVCIHEYPHKLRYPHG